MSLSNKIDKVFILNDQDSADKLNLKFNVTKFKYIPDPLPEVKIKAVPIISDLELAKDSIKFLHFGAMGYRKGTIDILKAIQLIPKDKKYTFIFAGKIHHEIEKEFFSLVDEIKDKQNLIVINEFCSYSILDYLCKNSDCILIPYKITSQSSGLLGHASKYKIPVIGPNQGLIGKLIHENNLGTCLKEITPSNICDAILQFTPYRTSEEYYRTNTIENFQNQLLCSWNLDKN